MRGTSRSAGRLPEIEAAGIEAAIADPARPGTVLEQIADVTLLVWLLGGAVGDEGTVAGLHGERLEHLLARLVDTPVRGFVYEAVGGVDRRHLAVGVEAVERAAETWRIPIAILSEEPGGDASSWEAWARATVEELGRMLA